MVTKDNGRDGSVMVRYSCGEGQWWLWVTWWPLDIIYRVCPGNTGTLYHVSVLFDKEEEKY